MSHKVIRQINRFKKRGPSLLYLVDYHGKNAIKKQFKPHRDERYFENEVLAVNQFAEYDWFPVVYEIKDNYILYEYYPHCLNIIIFAAYDIYQKGFAHRDIHCKNILLNNSGDVKIIDWEFLAEREDEIDFIDSYDVVGRGIKDGQVHAGSVYLFDKQYRFSVFRFFNTLDLDYIKNVIN